MTPAALSPLTTHKIPFRLVILAAAGGKPVEIGSILEDDLNFVRRLNKYTEKSESPAIKGTPRAAVVPFSGPTKKAPELSIDFVADIALQRCCFGEVSRVVLGKPGYDFVVASALACCADGQPDWRFMFGVSIIALFSGMCCFSDLAHGLRPRLYWRLCDAPAFFVDHRKNDTKWKDHTLRPPSATARGGYRGVTASGIFLAARARFTTGPILGRVWTRGVPHLAPPFIESGPDIGELRTMSLSNWFQRSSSRAAPTVSPTGTSCSASASSACMWACAGSPTWPACAGTPATSTSLSRTSASSSSTTARTTRTGRATSSTP
jgi:hypothetical protein